MNDLFSLLTIIGFWGWVCCAIVFIIKSFPAKNIFCVSAGRRWGGGIVIFYFLWITGMLNA